MSPEDLFYFIKVLCFMFLVIPAAVAVPIIFIVKMFKYDSAGITVGVCTEVKAESSQVYHGRSEYSKGNYEPYLRHYPYIKYTWEGKEYIARSYRAYSDRCNIFPRDVVNISVNAKNKELVYIIGATGQRVPL